MPAKHIPVRAVCVLSQDPPADAHAEQPHARRADDLTLVTMRKPGEQLTWDNQTFKGVPDYSWVPQCVALHPCLGKAPSVRQHVIGITLHSRSLVSVQCSHCWSPALCAGMGFELPTIQSNPCLLLIDARHSTLAGCT